MPDDGLRHDAQYALYYVWLILGCLSGVIVVAPVLLSPEFLFSVFPICSAEAAGGECLFCGMTTAFRANRTGGPRRGAVSRTWSAGVVFDPRIELYWPDDVYNDASHTSMQILGLVWGILAILGLGVAFIPCLGWLNWANIPFAVVGLIISMMAKTRRHSGAAVAGIVLNAIAIVLGLIRLKLGFGRHIRLSSGG